MSPSASGATRSGAVPEPPGPPGGRVRRALSRMFAPQQQIVAEHEQQESSRLGGTPVADLVTRRPATVCGVLRTVTLRPRAGVPALEAELYDGTGTLTVVWLGCRRITGIEAGRRIRVQGMITEVGGTPAVYNPRYELVTRVR